MSECQSFADYPLSTTEIRADRGEQRPTPRDMLISALRDLDSGKIKPSQLFIGYEQEHEDDLVSYGFYKSCQSLTSALGLLECVKGTLFRNSGGSSDE